MAQVGTEVNPLRVAIVGAGPSGFYTADHLFKRKDLVVTIDMFERLPTPFGLVRGGVAPDHQKIKTVTKAYDRIATSPGFRFFGNMEFGTNVGVEDLKAHYHQIVYTTGAEVDRTMDIPGEDLKRSHAATEFVAWYNGHPDYRDYEFDLSQERVVVVGVGNVAVDVCRILCRTPDELAKTDIADHALEALRESSVKEVYMLGRRGPAQAAFTNPELRELGEMPGADLIVLPEEAELDPLSETYIQENEDLSAMKKVEMLQAFAHQEPDGKPRRLVMRFLVSPVELIGNDAGEVVKVKLVRNVLYATDSGTLRPKASNVTEDLEAGLVFRSVGYRSVPLPGVPFNDKWGVISNEKGRVTELDSGAPVVGQYTAGWIKRGPTGVIGTNKPDALETVECMMEDVEKGRHLDPPHPEPEAAERTLRERQPALVTYEDWQRLDEIERSRGMETGRPRVKFTRVEEMLEALGKVRH